MLSTSPQTHPSWGREVGEGLPGRTAKCQRREEEGTHVQTRLGPSQPPAWVKVLGVSVGTRTLPRRAARGSKGRCGARSPDEAWGAWLP